MLYIKYFPKSQLYFLTFFGAKKGEFFMKQQSTTEVIKLAKNNAAGISAYDVDDENAIKLLKMLLRRKGRASKQLANKISDLIMTSNFKKRD
mmetsp:Transcript_8610/g.16420  ORF Transcript_8610/g.16420 Transcript_8610/m.16420 type:complete len:92 (-) Transcript_8610:549-824(-)